MLKGNIIKRVVALITLILLLPCLFISLKAKAESSAPDYTFEMDNRASVRLIEPYGIRFVTKIGKDLYDEVDNFYMIIVPNSYISKYVTATENIDYFAELSQNAPTVTKIRTKNYLDEDGYYYASGALVDILYKNLNRDFFATAFYIDGDGVRHYADAPKGNPVRNIAQVAKSAVESGIDCGEDGENYLKQTVAYSILASKGYSESVAKDMFSDEETDVNIDLIAENNSPKIVFTGSDGEILSGEVSFSSDNETVASIDENGVIVEGANGIAKITCSGFGKTFEYNYIVNSQTYWYDAGGSETDTKLAVTDTSLLPTTIYIPSFINNKPVKSFIKYFLTGTSVESVIFSDFIEVIDGYTFNKTLLTKVVLPKNLVEIGASAFTMCSMLTTVVFPPKLTTIKGYAFNNTAIKEVVFPKSLTAINARAFQGVYLDYAVFIGAETWSYSGTTIDVSNLKNVASSLSNSMVTWTKTK